MDPREQPTVLEPHEGAERHAPGDVAAARPRGSARQRRRALRIRIALTAAGFVLLVLARGMGLVEARGPRDDPAPRNAAAARPLPTPTLALAFDPRIAAMLAGDEQLARSALLYGAELDVKSRRSLMSALHALAGQRVADALPLLESFVRDNPRCGLTSLARFWIAAGELASGRADEAGAAFAALVADAPRSRFAPRALLLEAAARGARGDDAGRARLLERLAAEYPASAAARDASRPFAAG